MPMKTTTTRPRPLRQPAALWYPPRAATTPVPAPTHPLLPIPAGHDFLVPNPRADLTFDQPTLHMLAAR
jgi:hypothetical protein